MSWLRLNIQRPLSLLFVGVLFFAYSTNAQAPLDVRVALVIGNAAYKNVPALANATNDAKSMSSVLRKLGFNVIEVVDGDKAQMVKAIAQMQTLLQGKQAVGMLYYAGHGLQLDWRNYMVPVDAKLSQASDIATQTVDIENVIDTMKRSATRMNIIVLDACRDNPFSGKASGKGLAQLDAPPGTYLAFATSPGNVAEDGDESASNGLFTHYLLKELQRPARIEDLFKRVRLQVRQKSQGRQIPWDSSSLEDDFAFNDGVKHTFNPEDLIKEAQLAKEAQAQLQRAAQAAAEREKQIAQQIALEQQQLAEALKIQNLNARLKAESEAKERERQLALAAEQERQKAQAAALALERARAEEAQRIKDLELAKAQAAEEARRNKLSREEAQAQQFAQEKSAWDKIKDSRNKADVYAFILQFPNGMLSELANTQLELLDKAQIKPQADKQGRTQEFAQRRYTQGETFEFIGKDGYTGLLKWNQSFTVLSVDDEGAEVQGTRTGGGTWKQRVSHAGLQSGDNSGKYDPPITFMPAGIVQVGYKWRARTTFTNARNNAQEWLEVAAKVVARETIEVPAGKFDTFKIEVAMQYQSGHRTQLTIWTDPAIGAGIRIKSESRPPRGSADITIRELTSIKRGS
jgi:chemotaxis protein histidine kinase CheA